MWTGCGVLTGRIESIMVSAPPLVAWRYNVTPEPGSPEYDLVKVPHPLQSPVSCKCAVPIFLATLTCFEHKAPTLPTVSDIQTQVLQTPQEWV